MEQGSFYHIYNRGNNKQAIFFEEKNFDYFLTQFNKYLSPFVDVYAYCLMPNHFHFLIKIKVKEQEAVHASEVFNTSDVVLQQTSKVFETSEVLPRGSKKLSPLEKAFKDFFISYKKNINKAYNRTGSLFQAKFKKKEITADGYFTSLIQYIHANPVKAGLSKTYVSYKYSSYKAINDNSNTKIKRTEVLAWFGNRAMFIKVHEKRKIEIDLVEKYIF